MLKTVPISAIRENPVALRTVNVQTEEYQGLVESIRNKGFIGAISVRPARDSETKEVLDDKYELVDGLHRFTAAKDAGLDEINVDVVDLNDDEVAEAQIMANIHKVETKPMEYTKALKHILTRNPLMTESELAQRLGKSSAWIAGRLSLHKIASETTRKLIDDGKIGLSNAYALAKLPAEEQADWTDRAMTLSPDEFIPQTTARMKEIREARRKGKDAKPAEFQPVPHLQKLGDMKEELESGQIGQTLVNELGVTSAVDGFALGIKWALHMDPRSVEVQKEKDAERRAQREEKKKQKAAERAAAKAAKLKKELDEATAAAEQAQEEVAAS